MASKGTAGRMKVIFAFLLLFGPALLLILISNRSCDHKFLVLDDYGQANDLVAVTIQGDTITPKTFKDKILLVANLQTTCPDSCGVSFWSFDQLVYQEVRKNQKNLGDVRIITFVTDLEGNPVADLEGLNAMLQDRIVGFDPKIWILATGDSRAFFNVSHNNTSLLEEGEQYTGGEAFQELMMLVDKNYHVRMVLNGHTEGMVRKMKEHIALLLKEYDKEQAKKN